MVIVEVELDLSNYATKPDLEKTTGVDTLQFPKKDGLADLKLEVEESDIDKLENVSSGLNNLKSKVDDLIVDKLVPVPKDLSKLNDVAINNVVQKANYIAKIKDVEDKIPDITYCCSQQNPDHSKYITTPDFNSSAAKKVTATLNLANLATKDDIADFIKKTDFDNKLKNVNEIVILNKSKIYQLKMNLKNCKIKWKKYKHVIQVFLSVRVTFSIMERNFT